MFVPFVPAFDRNGGARFGGARGQAGPHRFDQMQNECICFDFWRRAAHRRQKSKKMRNEKDFLITSKKIFSSMFGVNVDASTPVSPQTWLRSPRNFATTRFRRSPSIQFSARKKKIGEIFQSWKSFYAFLAQFWRIYGETDLNGDFLAIFRSRCTYFELCTTKNRRKYMSALWGLRYPPCPVPPLCVRATGSNLK